MTFEEFLIKKKIDLAQLKASEPDLASEFESHYRQMGEKSFDHSKKFLFNKLRRAYHIKDEPKPVVPKEVIQVNKIASQAEPLLSPSVEATVYTPRFKPVGINTAPQTHAGDSKKENTLSFKPRFNPGVTKTAHEEYHANEAEEVKAEITNTGYKPRFKAVSAPQKDLNPEIDTSASSDPKPGFKPRFKPGITNIPPEEFIPESKNENRDEKPKPVYKPRFKPEITDTRATEPASEGRQENITGEGKPAYKPRFKAATHNPKNRTDGQEE